tara:strand:- start:309 stop:428 length:120 start_codon:yes stop_codon:yes gene_type:complete
MIGLFILTGSGKDLPGNRAKANKSLGRRGMRSREGDIFD